MLDECIMRSLNDNPMFFLPRVRLTVVRFESFKLFNPEPLHRIAVKRTLVEMQLVALCIDLRKTKPRTTSRKAKLFATVWPSN